MTRRIYHVADKAHWAAAQEAGDYRRSTRDQSLDEVGYLHGANPEQVRGVLDRYYLDATDLVLLVVDTELVADLLRDENTSGGTELFPHLYGPLPVDAVVEVIQIDDPSTFALAVS